MSAPPTAPRDTVNANAQIPTIYKLIIDDVIKNMKEEFASRGVEDYILRDFRQLWESKVYASNVSDFPPNWVTGGVLPTEIRAEPRQTPPSTSHTDGPVDTPVPRRIPQMDGADEDDQDEDDLDVDDDDLGSDLNSDSDEDNDEEYENLIVCQYEKVNHIRNRWKCSLKDGIMHVDGKDYMFSKATGDFEW